MYKIICIEKKVTGCVLQELLKVIYNGIYYSGNVLNVGKY